MKRLIRSLALIIAMLLPTLAAAHVFEVDGIYYNIRKDNTVSVTYKLNVWDASYSGAVTIPSTVIYDTVEYSVTGIDSYAFQDCSSLISVSIPNSVKKIGSCTFKGCSSLTSISIPNSVTTIGEGPFGACTSLKYISVDEDNPNYCSVNGVLFNKDKTKLIQYPAGIEGVYSMPKNVTYIENYAFYGCGSLTSVTIPNSVTEIGPYTFYDCGSLTSVTIPNSVTTIYQNAFSHCSSLESVTIPNSVTVIGSDAFSYCSSLESVTIPNSVTVIGSDAFYKCSSLTSVTVPNSVTDIGARAFQYCSSLISVSLPNSITQIRAHTFYGCTSLTTITIPESVTSIGEYAFYSCYSLNTVDIPCSVTTIGKYAFSGCAFTSVNIPSSVTILNVSIFLGCRFLTTVIIPNSITAIYDCAFCYCESLTSVYIPNSVTSIGEGVFEVCVSLSEITCLATTPPELGSDVFKFVDKTACYIYVPAESIELYKAAKQWKDFLNIKAIGEDDTEPGDLNGDGVVTIADINLLIELIMGGHPAGVDEAAADVNGDGNVTIADVNALISKIMEAGTSRSAARMNTPSFGSLSAHTWGDGTYTLDLDEARSCIGMQLDITLPDGCLLNDIALNPANSDLCLQYAMTAPDRMRVVVYSPTNTPFDSTDLIDIALSDTSNGDITVDNVLVSVNDGDSIIEHAVSGCSFSVNDQLGIAGTAAHMRFYAQGRTLIVASSVDSTISITNTSGQCTTADICAGRTAIELPSPGIYLVNGKKICIK